ncbi:MAG: hypothetical protein IT457_03675 [Planctomycetes bacterium]|nr:hypothetical protein [Planctomycetota bacterium]
MRSSTLAFLLASAVPALAQDRSKPWYQMDYGPCLATSAEGFTPDNVALKGRIVRLGERAGVLFDTELLRVAAAFVDGYVELRGTPFDGSHGPIPRTRGRELYSTRQEPGVAKDGSFADPRPIPHGPLPREHGRFEGHWFYGDQTVLQYRIGARRVLELHELAAASEGLPAGLARLLEFGPGPAVTLLVLDQPGAADDGAAVTLGGDGRPGSSSDTLVTEFLWERVQPAGEGRPERREAAATRLELFAPIGTQFVRRAGRVELVVPAADHARFVRVVVRSGAPGSLLGESKPDTSLRDLSGLTKGGPKRCAETLRTKGRRGEGAGPFVVDTVTVPDANPWQSRLRFGAFDFVGTEAAALSTWNGDVWIVRGLDDDLDELTWTRFCTGLHDPLGLKVVNGVIHTHGRDGLYRLRDVNHDGECDFVEVFNNDVLITQGFHEFAFDLQTDAAGNFYFSKGGPVNPGGRGFQKIVPHHGTLMRVSADGTRLEVVATGLRAPNGIGVSPDGVLSSGDNQGSWMPACRLNLSTNGSFWGCMATAHREPAPTTYDEPVCWLPMSVDNSGGGQVWIPKGSFGALGGMMIHQSYGQSSNYLVLMQEHAGKTQGAVVRLPADFESAQMRGRFHSDGHLYVTGFQGWQTNAAKETAFQRLRRTSAPLHLPIAMRCWAEGIELEFSEPLAAETAADPTSWEIEVWNYLWSEAYGSAEYQPSAPAKKVKEGEKNRDVLKVRAVELAADGRKVFLAIDGMTKAMQLRLGWSVDAQDGAALDGELHGTIHFLPPRPAGDAGK